MSLCCLAACGQSSTAALQTWEGRWQAAEPLFLSQAANPAYQAINTLRPEYSVEELQALFVAAADVDYTFIEVDGRTLTFLDGDSILCAGEYSSPQETMDFGLEKQTEGDCGRYEAVTLTELLPSGSEVHFHIITGAASGPLHPPPWNPSVWAFTTTPERFGQQLEAAAQSIASALPAK